MKKLLVILCVALVLVIGVSAATAKVGGPLGPSRSWTTTSQYTVFGDVNNGGYPTPQPVFSYVCTSMNARQPDAGIAVGDYINSVDPDWTAYLGVESIFNQYKPVWRAAGDNDHLDSSAYATTWANTFTTGNIEIPNTSDTGRRWWSTTTADGLHVVFLCTMYAGHSGWIGYYPGGTMSTQATWLVNTLTSIKNEEGPSTIIVVMHHPTLRGKTTGAYAKADGSPDYGHATEAANLQTLFADAGVDLVLSGDTHVFRQSRLTVHNGGIDYVEPYLQIAPAASVPRAFGTQATPTPIPSLESSGEEGSYALASTERGYVTVAYRYWNNDPTVKTLYTTLWTVLVSDGTSSQQSSSTWSDVPEGSTL